MANIHRISPEQHKQREAVLTEARENVRVAFNVYLDVAEGSARCHPTWLRSRRQRVRPSASVHHADQQRQARDVDGQLTCRWAARPPRSMRSRRSMSEAHGHHRQRRLHRRAAHCRSQRTVNRHHERIYQSPRKRNGQGERMNATDKQVGWVITVNSRRLTTATGLATASASNGPRPRMPASRLASVARSTWTRT